MHGPDFPNWAFNSAHTSFSPGPEEAKKTVETAKEEKEEF